jgi:hypothetical protein
MPTVRGIPGSILGSNIVYSAGGCLNSLMRSYFGENVAAPV